MGGSDEPDSIRTKRVELLTRFGFVAHLLLSRIARLPDMRRLGLIAVVALALSLLCVAVTAARTVASLEDGPSEMAAKAAQAAADGMRHAAPTPTPAWEQSFLQQQTLRSPLYTEEQRMEHLKAAQAAHAYAAQYVKQHQMTQQQQKQQTQPKPQQRSAGPNAAKPKFAASTYELIARAQQVTREAAMRRKQEAATASSQQQQQKPSDAFHFADAGAFIEEGVHLKHSAGSAPAPKGRAHAGAGASFMEAGGRSRARAQGRARSHAQSRGQARAGARSRSRAHAGAGGPFAPQEWTYSDTSAPPSWLQPSTDGLQGLPTTKPPPVPRMPPPPPPQPTPTWMSPFDEHQTPVFPQSTTPAPFYGMGPAPPGPPANYLPLDAFLSPAPEGEAAGGGAGGAPAEAGF